MKTGSLRLIIIISSCILMQALPLSSQARTSRLSLAAQKRFHVREILADSNTMPLAKRLFLDRENTFATAAADSFLLLLDSFPDMDDYHKGFYFITLSSSYHYSDGMYSEGLCAAGFDYVLHHEEEFLNYFIGKGKLSEQVLNIWSTICAGELRLQNDTASTNNFIKAMWKPGLTLDQNEILSAFMYYDAILTRNDGIPYFRKVKDWKELVPPR